MLSRRGEHVAIDKDVRMRFFGFRNRKEVTALRTRTGRNNRILKCFGWTAWMWEKKKRVRFDNDAKVKWLKNEHATKWCKKKKKNTDKETQMNTRRREDGR